MAETTITNMVSGSGLTGEELFEIAQSGNTRKVNFNSLRNKIKSLFNSGVKEISAIVNGIQIPNGLLETDTSTPTDLTVDCGTDKTLKLNQAVWDDLRTPANGTKKITGKEPKDQLYKGGEVLKFEKTQDQAVGFNVQLPHAYKLGTDIEFHIHIVPPVAGSGGGAENVKFDFTYSWAKIDGTFATETSVNATIDLQNEPVDKHILMEIEDAIDGSAIDGVSSMLICSLTRDVSVANNYDENIYLIEVDFHYQIDTMGSRQEAVK